MQFEATFPKGEANYLLVMMPLAGRGTLDRSAGAGHSGIDRPRSPNTSHRVLAVETLPEPNGRFADPLGRDLGQVRVLRTSPLSGDTEHCGRLVTYPDLRNSC